MMWTASCNGPWKNSRAWRRAGGEVDQVRPTRGERGAPSMWYRSPRNRRVCAGEGEWRPPPVTCTTWAVDRDTLELTGELEEVGVFVLWTGTMCDLPMRNKLYKNLGWNANSPCDACGIRTRRPPGRHGAAPPAGSILGCAHAQPHAQHTAAAWVPGRGCNGASSAHTSSSSGGCMQVQQTV
jgi:hypothetical protein